MGIRGAPVLLLQARLLAGRSTDVIERIRLRLLPPVARVTAAQCFPYTRPTREQCELIAAGVRESYHHIIAVGPFFTRRTGFQTDAIDTYTISTCVYTGRHRSPTD